MSGPGQVQTIKNIDPTTDALLIPGVALPSAAPATPQYKAQAITRVEWVSLFNTDGSSRTATIHAIPPGGVAGVATHVCDQLLTAGQYLPLAMAEVLLTGYTLQLTASVAGVVRASVSGKVATL
jgi:hypothetical protein